jgi:hypothetical protein
MLVKGGKISGTEKTPEIILSTDGIIGIRGRWMMENSVTFSSSLSDWYDNNISDLHEINAIDIRLEYFSRFNLGIFISLLRKILCVKLIRREIPINWYYDEGDEEILDLGEYIASVLGAGFNFIPADEAHCAIGNSIHGEQVEAS